MKRILLLSLLLLPIVALAQYPTFSNKQKLGVQTTGDGLIFRGNNNPNYNPSNINNAYFYLDTTASKLYLYSVGTWQQVYPTASDTTSLGAYLLKSDTLAMLLPYLRKSDTISLSNRINNKLNATDTVSLSNRINLKLNKTDTINLSNRIDLKLNKSDTISLSNRIDIKLNASDTVSLSNRINTKLNSNDTINLSNRINKKLDTLYVNYQTNVDLLTNKDTINITSLEAGAGINITNNVISLDTTLLDSVVRVQNVYVKNGTGTVLNKGEAVYVTGANGTNIIVGRASNVAESSSSKTLGLTMTSIAINGFGYVVKEGLLAGLNTNSATAGDPIWLSNTPGGLIFGLVNKPYAPNHLVYLGVVTRKQQNNGEVYVTVQNGFEIKELHDVQIIDPVNKASLYYNSSQSLWRDTTAALLVSDTASMLSKYVNTYSNQTGINGDKTFNNNINIPSYDLGTFTSEKSFNVLFNNDANQKVRLYFPSGSRLQGGYEITLSSGYYFTQASGMLRKTYGVQLQEGGQLYVQSTNVPYVLGAIGNHFTISDFEYDSQTNTWGVIIACLNSNASNYVHINIKSYINPENLSTWLNARASAANITNIYTTNTTVYPNLNPTYLSKSDTASMLLPYVNTYNNQININGNKTFNNVVTIDSATVTGKLLVNTNISDAVKINSNTNSTNLELMNSDGSVYIKSSNKNMILQTDTTALVYLNGDNKKVGILTMNPQQELEVNGNARITGLNNNLVPLRIVGSSNNNDLTNVNLGEGLSFANDTLKVDLTIIDTAIAASSITLVGDVSGSGATNSTVNTIINNGVVTNDMLAGSIADTKLNTITTAGKVSNSATTATDAYPYLSQANTIVLRNSSGDFGARNIIATNFYGNATTSTSSYGLLGSLNSNEILRFKSTNSPSFSGVINMTTPNIDFNVASTNLSQTFGGTQTFSGTASFTGSVTGLTSSVVGLGNVTNESKATMFTSPTFTGTVNGVTKSMVGLSNVDNTSDLNKPISTATQTALNLKLNISDTSSMLTNYLRSGVAASTYQAKLNGTGFVKASGTNITYDNSTYLTTGTAASTYLPLTGGTTSGLITSSFTNTTNYSTNATDNNAFTIYNNTTSSNNIYGGLQFLIGQNSGAIPGGPGLAQIYAIRAGGESNPSTDLTFSTKGAGGVLEKMRIKFDGKVGIGTSTPSYLLDVNGTLGVTGATTLSSNLTVNGISNFKDLGNHTFVNYIQNGDFDLTSTLDASAFNYGYPHYIPLFWKSAATSKYVSTWSTTGGYNSSGVYQQYDGDSSTGGALYQDVVNWESLKGKTVTACGWFTKGTLANTGNHAEIQIDDGITTKSVGSIGTTTTWQRACVTKTISASATRVRVIVGCDLGVSNQGGALSGIDAISLVVGDGKHQFTPKPVFDSGNQRLAGSLTLGYDNEDNIAYNPAGTSTLKVASLSGTGTRMVVANNTGVLSTQAIPAGTLVGTDTVSLSNRINTKVGLTGNEYINGQKTFGGLIIPSNGMQLTATGNNSNKLIGINASSFVGEVTLGTGLTLTSNVLNASSTVTNVTGTLPISVANGTTTPSITIASATTSASGVVTTTTQSFAGSKTFTGLVGMQKALQRPYESVTGSTASITTASTWIVVNYAGTVELTFPSASASTGTEFHVKTITNNAVISATSNISPLAGGAASTSILSGTAGKWATLVSDGTNWVIMQAN